LNKKLFIQREAQEHRNEAADPFTRRRCAPTLVAKVRIFKFRKKRKRNND
jgi:hypothetical protein